MQFQLKGEPDVLFLVFLLSFFLSFFLSFWLSFDKWMALKWFCLGTWIKEDTLVGEKRVAERGRTRRLTVHPSIHLFHTFSLALVLRRVMRLEPFLGHRQDKPLNRWPVHHTHSYSHSLTVSSSPVLYVSGFWEKPRGNQHQQRENIQTPHRKTPGAAGTPILYIQHLIILDWWYIYIFNYYFRIYIYYYYFIILYEDFSQLFIFILCGFIFHK